MAMPDNMVFTRNIMEALLRWVRNDRGVLLQGPRQVGKTFILKQLGREQFKQTLFVNLRDPKIFNWFANNPGKIGECDPWIRVFSEFAKYDGQKFDNSKNTLVILDEVQLSQGLFNSMRDMVNDYNFKLSATGSYLGITTVMNRVAVDGEQYFHAAGDVWYLDMNPLTYREVIAACEKYAPKPFEEVYGFYLRFGGFPSVVKAWLQGKAVSASDHFEHIKQIYDTLINESQQYFEGSFPKSAWTNTLTSVIAQINRRVDVPISQKISFQLSGAMEMGKKKPQVIESLLWLESCNLLFTGDVFSNWKTIQPVRERYYFTDQGLMSLIVSIALSEKRPNIERSHMYGLLSENFAALAIREFTRPMTYSCKNPRGEIDFVSWDGNLATAVEVKFSGGETKTSDRLLKEGKIARLIKLANSEAVEDRCNVICLPLWEIYKLGEILGFIPGQHLYSPVSESLGFDDIIVTTAPKPGEA